MIYRYYISYLIAILAAFSWQIFCFGAEVERAVEEEVGPIRVATERQSTQVRLSPSAELARRLSAQKAERAQPQRWEMSQEGKDSLQLQEEEMVLKEKIEAERNYQESLKQRYLAGITDPEESVIQGAKYNSAVRDSASRLQQLQEERAQLIRYGRRATSRAARQREGYAPEPQ